MTREAHEDRHRAIRRVLLVTLALNLAVAAAKVVIGQWFHVISMTADGIHSSLDGFNNIVGMVALASARRPPDASHPYGHRKFETFAALGIAVLLGLVGVGLVRQAVLRFGSGIGPEAAPETFGAIIATICINTFVATYETRRGRALQSEFLVADAHHTRSDVFVSLAVLGALVAIRLRLPVFDLIATGVIVAFIARAAYSIVRESVHVLADAVAIEPGRVEAVVTKIPGVRSCHKIRTRGPAGHVFVDLHIQVDPYLTTVASHQIVHEVADALKGAIAGVEDVVIHTEPDTGAPGYEALDGARIEAIVRAVPGVRSCHKIRTRGPRGAVAIDLHVQVAPEMTTRASHDLGHRVADTLKREISGIADVLVHIEPGEG